MATSEETIATNMKRVLLGYICPQLLHPLEVFWFETETITSFRAVPNNHFDLWILFDGAMHLSVSDRKRQGTVGQTFGMTGLNTESIKVDFVGEVRGLHIPLTAAQFGQFVRFPLRDATGMTLDLADLWGKRSTELHERLRETRTSAGFLPLIQRFFLMENVSRDTTVMDRILFQVRAFSPPCTVSQLRESLGVSERQLERLFSEHIGIPPRSFLKINRFQQVMRYYKAQTQRNDRTSLLRIALEVGYYDQSHFIRDCHRLTGTSPDQYFKKMEPTVSGFYNAPSPPGPILLE